MYRALRWVFFHVSPERIHTWVFALLRVATGLAREASWVTAHLIAYPFGLIGESNTKPDQRHSLGGLNLHQRSLVHYAVDAAATPILLVHGIVDNHTIFDSLERALRRRGFSDLSSFDYGLLTTDVRATALDLATAVERLAPLFHLVNGKGASSGTVKALTIRIVLSVALFLLLLIAWSQGMIQPHGVGK